MMILGCMYVGISVRISVRAVVFLHLGMWDAQSFV